MDNWWQGTFSVEWNLRIFSELLWMQAHGCIPSLLWWWPRRSGWNWQDWVHQGVWETCTAFLQAFYLFAIRLVKFSWGLDLCSRYLMHVYTTTSGPCKSSGCAMRSSGLSHSDSLRPRTSLASENHHTTVSICVLLYIFFSHMCLSKVFNCSDGLDYMARSLAWKLLDHLLQTELCMAGSLKPNSGHGQVFQGHRILGSLVLFWWVQSHQLGGGSEQVKHMNRCRLQNSWSESGITLD